MYPDHQAVVEPVEHFVGDFVLIDFIVAGE
jgi:hypothetical protein